MGLQFAVNSRVVVYIARCRTEKEAVLAQSKLVSVCPTLVFTRILRRASDLDSFNSEALRAGDEGIATGALAYDQDAVRLNRLWHGILAAWFALLALASAPVIWFFSSNTRQPAFEMLLIWAIAFVLLAIFGTLSLRAFRCSSPASRNLWKARRWLHRGNFVVIAGSEVLPDDEKSLPRNVRYFDERAA